MARTVTTPVPAGMRRRVMRAGMIVAGAMGCHAEAPLAARDRPAPRDVGGWTVAASEDAKGCFVTRTYDRPGATTLLLGLDIDGANRLSVLNENWSIAPREKLKLTFRLSRGGYVGQAAVGIVSDGKQGFVTGFEATFPSYFAASPTLAIARGDVPVERLPLDGSGAAVARLRACVAALRAMPAARRDDRIPKDPFAANARRESGK
ncbi:hypothetical protein ASG29_03755 [Sphingomonas sp. Leaf412]|uniref:hypothetical protein n=1 Tax=Sphingomonas sp. Leaf412 TaxID=1736370 RepID=UPI0006F3D5B9|nr:hypothetical protein [Sphingomonas sp. Leaf412]KQT35236.1 hypothetical protein ASG29_03755 [Sphingomonas sp. Leaf412]